ncbi:hypothetical protein FHS51_004121 [Sphingobium wenxiniae]|nr:hypothetical protein [Sphingobium wenxiniae]MBB6193862.1 hypothetical protein [Sphingobium wenxiniae]
MKEYEVQYPQRWKPANLLKDRAEAGKGWKD